MLQISLFKKDPSGRSHVLVLNIVTQTFLKIKISNSDEIIDFNYADIKNAYMVFMTDCSRAYNAAKSSKKVRNNSECFNKYSLLWNLAPKDVKDEYEQVFTSYRGSHNSFRFVSCHPNGKKTISGTFI
jgi:hypothetical protein